MHIFAWWMAAALAWASLEQEPGYGPGQIEKRTAPKVLTKEEMEAAAKEEEITKKLNELFATKETEMQHKIQREGHMMVECRVGIDSKDFKTYSAFARFRYSYPGKDKAYYYSLHDYDILIIYNRPVTEAVPKSDGFHEMVSMIKMGWLPIFRTLKCLKDWDHEFKKKIIPGARKDTYDIEVTVNSTIDSIFKTIYSDRKLIIKSTFTAAGIIFTIKSDKDQNEETYSMKTPENFSHLTAERIKKHFKPRYYFSMYARYNAQIQRINRLLLLDDAQSSCEEE